MWKIWLLFDPRRALIALGVFVFGMVMLNHFIVLSTDKYFFFDGPKASAKAQVTPPSAPK